jgi:hypothetical protein
MVIIMKCPNRIPMIVGGVIGIVALVGFLLLPQGKEENPSLQTTKPSDSNIHVQVPTDPVVKPPAVIVPDDNDPTFPTNPEEGDPFVEKEETEDVEGVNPPTDDEETPPKDEVIDIGKDKETEQNNGEVRNDDIINEKEDAVAKEEEKDEHDVVIEVDTEVSTGEGKDEVHENEDQPNNNGDETNKNAPEYQPPAGGKNPFEEDVETEIVDKPVEDLIGEDEDRPGEGTHF